MAGGLQRRRQWNINGSGRRHFLASLSLVSSAGTRPLGAEAALQEHLYPSQGHTCSFTPPSLQPSLTHPSHMPSPSPTPHTVRWSSVTQWLAGLATTERSRDRFLGGVEMDGQSPLPRGLFPPMCWLWKGGPSSPGVVV